MAAAAIGLVQSRHHLRSPIEVARYGLVAYGGLPQILHERPQTLPEVVRDLLDAIRRLCLPRCPRRPLADGSGGPRLPVVPWGRVDRPARNFEIFEQRKLGRWPGRREQRQRARMPAADDCSLVLPRGTFALR